MSDQASDGLPQPRRRLAVLAIALASMMGTLDVNIANTALPTIARDLGIAPSTSIWIVNAYQIASVASLFTFAALGQLYGPARVYRLGVIVFIAASAVCALFLVRVIVLFYQKDYGRAVDAARGVVTGHPHWRVYQSRVLGPWMVKLLAYPGLFTGRVRHYTPTCAYMRMCTT